ncbi:excisionase [uncultured Rhodoferax sp.]|uniref:excisionase n=1 Tax=uncultured Rhodoferax sp. TaxID=223188 RepID=UPI0025DE34CC|nr:excisionase [uncultured Rhodoferax sp.]
MSTAEIVRHPAARAPGPQEAPVLVAPAPYVTIKLASVIIGLSEKAIRRKIEEGKWIDGKHYRRSPDGGIFVSIAWFVKWVEQEAE